MPLRDQLIKDGVVNDDILRLFKEAQQELVKQIESIEKGSTFGKFRRRHLLAIDRIIARLEKQSRRWAETTIVRIAEEAADEVYGKIKGFKETEFAVAFSGVPGEAVQSLIEQAWGDFGNTMIGLRRSARNAAIEKRKIQERIFKGFVQGISSGKTQADVVKELKTQGFTALRARNGFGRRISLEDYSNMLVRSQNMAAYNLGAKSQMMGSGRRYARFPTIRPDIDGDDICNEWERQEFVDLMTDELPPASTHPRCRHVVEPVSFGELKAKRPDLYANSVRFFREATGQ